jgi:hypothetical protein
MEWLLRMHSTEGDRKCHRLSLSALQIGFSDDMLLLSPRKQKRLHINLRKAGDAAADALRRQVLTSLHVKYKSLLLV